jgi:hypothetical protein
MSYDLGLNRLDHDMVFHTAPERKLTTPTGWDTRETTWDAHTFWDVKTAIPDVVKYTIWPIEGADKVAQQIKINLLSFLGEWFLDVTYGVPYLEEILVKNPHMASVETIIRNHISSVPNVIRIDSLSLDWNRQSRVLAVEFTCTTNLGPIKESVKLEVFRR